MSAILLSLPHAFLAFASCLSCLRALPRFQRYRATIYPRNSSSSRKPAVLLRSNLRLFNSAAQLPASGQNITAAAVADHRSHAAIQKIMVETFNSLVSGAFVFAALM